MIGWIKISRSTKEHWLWKDPVKFQWWIDLLISVNFKDGKTNIGNLLIECKRGQSIMSLKEWGVRWKVDKNKVRNFFILLEKDGMILHENMLKTTRITICNYDSYQGQENSNETQPKRNQNATKTQPNPIEESKNKKKYKDILMCNFDTSDCSEDFLKAYTIAESFRKKFIQIIESKGGSIKELEEAKVEAWVNPIILLQKTDKVSIDKIREVYKEFGNLEFWAGIVSSTSGVRKNFNKLVMAVDKLKPNQKVVSSEMTDAERNKLLRQQMGI